MSVWVSDRTDSADRQSHAWSDDQGDERKGWSTSRGVAAHFDYIGRGGALDAEMVNDVLEIMIELARDGMTMLCVTHEMSFARAVADRDIFMDAGQIIEANAPTEFFARPQHERTRMFLSRLIGH